MITFFSSVKNRVYVLLTFKGLLGLALVHDLLNLQHPYPFTVWILLLLCGLNDIVRGRSLLLSRLSNRSFLYSMVISIVLLAALHAWLDSTGLSALIQLTLIELLIFGDRLLPLLVMLTGLAYTLPNLISSERSVLIDDVINFAGFLVVGLLFRTIIAEKLKTEQLYTELQEANRKLKRYSETVVELAIEKERTKIAQELHDSMGHSFVALGMNLEYAYQAIDRYPDNTKKVLAKALTISKEGMASLRKAVDRLNQTDKIDLLNVSLTELFANFEQTAKVQFHLELDKRVEREHPLIKECLFKIVREALTNGIQHGEATLFNIRIVRNQEEIYMQIQNNGRAEDAPLVKSHGLLGMENRVKDLGGQLLIHSDNGFTIEVRLPVFSERDDTIL